MDKTFTTTKEDAMRLTYYAFARNPRNQIEQMLVTREGAPGQMRHVSQEWTGVTYRNEREAMADMARLNCKEG
jgi:hypothetical protein